MTLRPQAKGVIESKIEIQLYPIFNLLTFKNFENLRLCFDIVKWNHHQLSDWEKTFGIFRNIFLWAKRQNVEF